MKRAAALTAPGQRRCGGRVGRRSAELRAAVPCGRNGSAGRDDGGRRRSGLRSAPRPGRQARGAPLGQDTRADRVPRREGCSRAPAGARHRWPGGSDPEPGSGAVEGLARPLGDAPDADQRLHPMVRAASMAAGGGCTGGSWQPGVSSNRAPPHCCAARIAVASGRRSPIRRSRPADSTTSIRRHGSPTSSPASPPVRSAASTNCSCGIGSLPRSHSPADNPSRPSAYAYNRRGATGVERARHQQRFSRIVPAKCWIA